MKYFGFLLVYLITQGVGADPLPVFTPQHLPVQIVSESLWRGSAPPATRALSERVKQADLDEAYRLQELVHPAFSALERFCADMALSCQNYRPVRVLFTNDAPKIGNRHFTGKISEGGDEITISRDSKDIAATLFHELVHWTQLNLHTARGNGFRQDDWIVEGAPLLAALIYDAFLPDQGARRKLSQVELDFLADSLRGSLFQDVQSDNWFGLIGIWTRYLFYHVVDSKNLLKELLDSPNLDLGGLAIRGESLRGLQPTSKTFKNFFNYFIFALHANTLAIDPLWQLYYLGIERDSLRISSSERRILGIKAGSCISLEKMGFAFGYPDIIKPGLSIDTQAEVRVFWWKGGREKPLSLTREPISGEVQEGDRVVLYNPTKDPVTVCFKSGSP